MNLRADDHQVEWTLRSDQPAHMDISIRLRMPQGGGDWGKTYVPQLASYVSSFGMNRIGDEFPRNNVLWREDSWHIEEVPSLHEAL